MIFFELMSPICGDNPDAARWQPAPTQRHQGSHDCHFSEITAQIKSMCNKLTAFNST